MLTYHQQQIMNVSRDGSLFIDWTAVDIESIDALFEHGLVTYGRYAHYNSMGNLTARLRVWITDNGKNYLESAE